MAALAGASLLLVGAPAASSLARAPAPQAPAPPQAASTSPSAAGALAAARATLPASSPAARALAAARASGKPVAIPAATTQTSTTVANPDGTFATTTYPAPVRVKVGGVWTPTNATLRRNPAGTWSPAAVPNGLVLSGGGTGPLATFTSPAGGSLAISFPGRLPAPQVSGATATYPSVLPGVDLQVTATKLGGLSEVLIVRDAAAAANPALRHLRLPVRAGSLTLAADTHGNLTATGPGGLTEFTSPTPFAWDSATTATGSTARGTAANPALGRHTSSAAGPARGAHTAPVPRTVSGATLAMDTATVAPAWTAYPAYIATSIAPAVITAPPKPITALSSSSISTTALSTFNNTNVDHPIGFDEVQQGCPNTQNWNVSFQYGNGTGYDDYGGSCQGLFRAYYIFTTSGLTSAMHIQKATMYAYENYGADWTCSDKWSLTLHMATSFGSSTDWNNQPNLNKSDQPQTDHVHPGPNPNSSCTRQTVTFNVAYAIKIAASNGWGNVSFAFFGDENKVSTNYGFMRIGDVPHITTVYDLTPPVPTNPNTSPAAHNHPGGPTVACAGSTPYPWIGKADIGSGNGSDLTLQADVAPAISGEQVRGVFHMWDSNGEISGYPQDSSFVTGAHTATHQIGFALTDGQQYGWNAQANVDGNGTDTSSSGYTSAKTSPYCHFNVDLTAPTVPGVSSADFPPSGGSTPSPKYAGESGSFTFSSTDPPPANCTSGPCAASGVYEFQYSLNSPIPTSGASAVTAATSNGVATASVSLTPKHWGTNTLYVDAVDAAGNVSQTYQYDFYVPWNPTTTVNPGDINGDGIPDLLVTASNGNLVMYPGNTDPSATPVTVGNPQTSPDGTGWNTFQVTHRGSLTGQNVDDLFAHKGANMYVYINDGGVTPQFESGNVVLVYKPPYCTVCVPSGSGLPAYNSTDWSDVSQILAPDPGILYGTSGNPAPADLLTVENGELWFYEGGYGPSIMGGAVLLGSTGWSGMTLIAPGTVNGQLELWARDNATGVIYSYPLTMDSNGVPSLDGGGAPVTATSGTVVSGVTLPAASYPMVRSPGPLDNSSYPGLYAEDTSGNLWYYSGQSTSGGASPLTGSRVLAGKMATP